MFRPAKARKAVELWAESLGHSEWENKYGIVCLRANGAITRSGYTMSFQSGISAFRTVKDRGEITDAALVKDVGKGLSQILCKH